MLFVAEIKLDVVAVICNPSSGKIEAGGWQMWGHPLLQPQEKERRKQKRQEEKLGDILF